MAYTATSSKVSEENIRSGPEYLARHTVEEGMDRRLGDPEWTKHRQRLLDFILTLARWDLNRRRTESPKR